MGEINRDSQERAWKLLDFGEFGPFEVSSERAAGDAGSGMVEGGECRHRVCYPKGCQSLSDRVAIIGLE